MIIPEFWLGSEASLQYVLDSYERYLANPQNYPPQVSLSEGDEDAELYDPADELITIQDGLGIMTVSGPLVSEESWFDHYFGIMSYPMIGRAVVKLVEKYEAGEIHDIIHVWNTSGGDASGVDQLSETLKIAAQRAPNTVSWTGTRALSAGYWLSATNPTLRMDKMAEVGSIGVVATAISVAKRLEKDGIEAKIVRAGDNKALLHPYEPLSEKGIKELQAKADQLHGFFLDHVIASRSSLSLNGKDTWGDGRTFFAQEAIALGLADGPPTGLSSLANSLVSRHNAENGQRKYTFGGTDMTQKVLFPNEEVRAQVASGVDLSQVPHEIVDDPVEEDDDDESGDEVKTLEQGPAASAPSEGQDDNTVIGFLRAELRDAQAQILALATEKEGLSTKVTQLSAVESTLAPIVIEAIQRLQVGLGQTPTTLDGLPAATLAQQYAQVRETFERRYPAGRRSLAEGTADRKPVDIAEARLSLVK
jgi:ClpP class serine protease